MNFLYFSWFVTPHRGMATLSSPFHPDNIIQFFFFKNVTNLFPVYYDTFDRGRKNTLHIRNEPHTLCRNVREGKGLLIGCPSRKWMLWRTSPCFALKLSSQYLMMLWRSYRKARWSTWTEMLQRHPCCALRPGHGRVCSRTAEMWGATDGTKPPCNCSFGIWHHSYTQDPSHQTSLRLPGTAALTAPQIIITQTEDFNRETWNRGVNTCASIRRDWGKTQSHFSIITSLLSINPSTMALIRPQCRCVAGGLYYHSFCFNIKRLFGAIFLYMTLITGNTLSGQFIMSRSRPAGGAGSSLGCTLCIFSSWSAQPCCADLLFLDLWPSCCL